MDVSVNSIKKVIRKCIKALLVVLLYVFGGGIDKDIKIVKGNIKGLTGKKIILFVTVQGWNVVDSSLPVLTWLCEHHSDTDIVSFLSSEESNRLLKANNKQYKKLLEVSDCIVINSLNNNKSSVFSGLRLFCESKKKYKNVVFYKTIKYVFRNVYVESILIGADDVGDNLVAGSLEKIFPNSNVVVIQHQGWDVGDLYNIIQDGKRDAIHVNHYLLTNPGLERRYINGKGILFHVIGTPKYDKWWRKREKNDIVCKEKNVKSINKTILLLAIPYLQDYRRFSKEERVQLSCFLESLDVRKYSLIIKFHPRDDNDVRNKYLMDNIPTGIQVIVSNASVTRLTENSDIGLCIGATGCVMDMLVSDKPVVTFYDSSIDNSLRIRCGNNYYRDSDCLDITIHCDDKNELYNAVNSIIYYHAWDEYKGRYKRYSTERENSSKMACEYLLMG